METARPQQTRRSTEPIQPHTSRVTAQRLPSCDGSRWSKIRARGRVGGFRSTAITCEVGKGALFATCLRGCGNDGHASLCPLYAASISSGRGVLAIAQDFKPDIRVRIPPHGLATGNNIGRRSAKRRARLIVDGTESVGRYLRLRTIGRMAGSIFRRGRETREVVLRGRCPLNEKSGLKGCERCEFDSARHGHFSSSGCVLTQEVSVAFRSRLPRVSAPANSTSTGLIACEGGGEKCL